MAGHRLAHFPTALGSFRHPHVTLSECPPAPDRAYLDLVGEVFPPHAARFRPDLIVWYFGFDTHRGDYGDLGLTAKTFLGIAELMVEVAARTCGGKLVVVLGGGSRTDLATALIPPVIARLAGVPVTGEK